jgi:hypothetical protein
MARRVPNENWGHAGNTVRTAAQFQTLAAATKLRCLADMSEREIRALEREYGATIVRPVAPTAANNRRRRRRRARA